MGARINLLQIPTGDLEEIRKYLISQKLELERWNNIISFHTHRGTLNDFDGVSAGAVDHNSLTGIQGGSALERYHGTLAERNSWNTAYGWGNHASAGYLTSATAATTYVPYTGATTDLAMGAHDVTANNLHAGATLTVNSTVFLVNGTTGVISSLGAGFTVDTTASFTVLHGASNYFGVSSSLINLYLDALLTSGKKLYFGSATTGYLTRYDNDTVNCVKYFHAERIYAGDTTPLSYLTGTAGGGMQMFPTTASAPFITPTLVLGDLATVGDKLIKAGSNTGLLAEYTIGRYSLLGRTSVGTGSVEEITSAAAGTKYLRDDLTWQTVSPSLPALTTSHIWAGVANVATDCAVSGDVTMSASGTTVTTAIASGVIVNDDINASAAIATTKLGAGAVIQMVATLNTSYTTTGTTTMPLDDTIPQGNEGVAFSNTASFTPKASTSQLRIDVIMNVMCASQHHMTMGLFTATGAVNAIASCTMLTPVAGNMFIMSLTHYMNATDTSARTFYVRVGSHAGGTVRLNSLDGNRWLGGTLQSSIVVTEISQ